MTTERDQRIVDLIGRLEGEGSLDSPRALAILAEHPDLKEEIMEILSVTRDLDMIAGDRREIERLARLEVTDSDRIGVERLLARARSRGPGRLWLLAVAALLAIVLALNLMWRPTADQSGMLSGDAGAHMEREGNQLVVCIEAQLPPGGEYRLRLRPGVGSGTSPATISHTQTRWTLPPAWHTELSNYKDARLFVDVLDTAGAMHGGVPIELKLPASLR